jgi:hypothetical protein
LKITSRLNTQNRDRAEQKQQRATDDRGRRDASWPSAWAPRRSK